MPLPLDASEQIFENPRAADRLRREFGGTREVDSDGSVYSSIGNQPIPPPKAMRLIHAQRQEQIQQREEDKEADVTMREYGMRVGEDRTLLNPSGDRAVQGLRLQRRAAQQDLEVPLCETACEYEVGGCGLAECNGRYAYAASSRHGAPVYRNPQGWTLHRDRPPVEATIGSEAVVSEFGWLISKEGRPFYAAKTDEMVAPSHSWECFLGPPPSPSCVSHTSWERHLLEQCGPRRESGNAATKQARYAEALGKYSEALAQMDGYDDVVASSKELQQLQIALCSNRAEVRLRLRQWGDALEDCRWVLERDTGHVKAAVRLAKACRGLGRWADAVGALQEVLQAAGPRGVPELRELLEEARLVASCEAGTSELAGAFRQIQLVKERLGGWQPHHAGGDDELRSAVQNLCASLRELAQGRALDTERLKELGLLVQGTMLLDTALDAASDPDALGGSDWNIELLSACVLLTTGEGELRRVLAALPAAAPQLASRPPEALGLARRLLRHPLRQQLKVADSIIEAPGLLAGCLRPWARLLDERSRGAGPEGAGESAAAAEVLLSLGSQAVRLDSTEALALALFVECFVGERFEKVDGTKAMTGGFVLYSGGAARQVVLSLLRRWAEDPRVLQSLSPELVGRVWLPLLTKLRRDAGLEVEKLVPSGPSGTSRPARPLRLEWFRLKHGQALRRGPGAFHPEELLEALLGFLCAHLGATCARGCEQRPAEGIDARHPAEEWLEEVVDRPFGWGLLLPLVVAPPPVSTGALALLELLIDRYPHGEKLAKRLAGLHAFLPLLGLPWPLGPQPRASSHLGATMALGPAARCAAAKLLRCAIDTEMGLHVVQDHAEACLEAAVDLLMGVLADRDRPDAAVAAIEVVGIITGNLQCWSNVPEVAVAAIVEEFVHSTHAGTRAQLAKLLRLAHSDAVTGTRMKSALEDERLGLDERQQAAVMREVFDVRTLAGQHKAKLMLELQRRQEQTPVEAPLGGELSRRHMAELVAAVHEAYLQHLQAPRVLIMGRIARSLCHCFGSQHTACRLVLGETTLERLAQGELGPGASPVLLPVPQGVAEDPQLASQELFDLVVTGEPVGYFDVGEYADHLRPFIKRREREDERQRDQVQWVCIELHARLEDACDELYSAGYYKADHDRACENLRRLARRLDRDVALFALPSQEKEQRKHLDERHAVERKARRVREDEAREIREAEEERRRGVLYETLFDPLLSVPEVGCLPVVFETGAARGEEDLLLIWLPSNSEDPQACRTVLRELCGTDTGGGCPQALFGGCSLRIMVPTFPEGRSRWFDWTDEVAINFGIEWFEMAEGPCKEDAEKAAKDPAKNISFGRPSFEELQGLEELEVSCKQLLNLAEDEVLRGLGPGGRIAFGGFSQGGAVAVYAALGGLASEELRQRLPGVVVCCSGLPVLHFLAPRLQAACLRAREEEGVRPQPFAVHMIYGHDDPEVKESFVETACDLCRRFGLPVELQRFRGSAAEDRFPEEARLRHIARAVAALRHR